MSYENYLELEPLFEAVDLPGQGDLDTNYAVLYYFLVTVPGLEQLPRSQAAIHTYAFTLL